MTLDANFFPHHTPTNIRGSLSCLGGEVFDRNFNLFVGKIQEILFNLGSTNDRRRREISHKIVKFIANNRIYNERVQSTLKLSKPIIQSSL